MCSRRPFFHKEGYHYCHCGNENYEITIYRQAGIGTSDKDVLAELGYSYYAGYKDGKFIYEDLGTEEYFVGYSLNYMTKDC
ncbi:hypothetical protein [Mangrovibacillus cuniculi]|uniref:Uncharacterized protein n=1 Tax=Mangrovibacillus cuniculi TaxID=2593652 RepID=A0A7S8HG60_9BACI|nr:hypothetical protein [Mangrovibacillus cuniculi]QPC47543.1 hypothetical protein G8O30_11575 [Mangrovibacillus cuniculi]